MGGGFLCDPFSSCPKNNPSSSPAKKMPSLESISIQIEATAWRKENLRKAFEELQSHSSSLSFPLQWEDIEAYFDPIQKSIDESFSDLSLRFSAYSQPSDQVEDQNPMAKNWQEPSACGLRSLIIKNLDDLPKIERKLAATLGSSSDPAGLGLDVMDGLDDWKGVRLLLETVTTIAPEIKPSVQARAMELAGKWKKEIKIIRGANEGAAFMRLVVAYDLASYFEEEELVKFICKFPKKMLAINFCRKVGLEDKIPDMIQKLISEGRHVVAINFVCAFELADKFPPVSLLEAYLKETKKDAQEICRRGNDPVKSQIKAAEKELMAMRVVRKCIGKHKLEAGSLRENVEKCIAELEKQQAERKRKAATASPKPQKQPMNKRPQPDATVAAGLPKTKKHKSQPNSGATPVPKMTTSGMPLQPAAAASPQITNIRPPTQPAPAASPQITNIGPPPQPAPAASPQITNIGLPPQPASSTSSPQMVNSRARPQLAANASPQMTNIRALPQPPASASSTEMTNIRPPPQPTAISLTQVTNIIPQPTGHSHVSPLASSGSYGLAGHSAGHSASYDHLGYRLSGGPSSFGGNWRPPRSHLYSSEAPSSLYNKPMDYHSSTSLPPFYHQPYVP